MVAIDVAAIAHGAIGFAVSVSVTEPAVTSPAPGVYVVLVIEASPNEPSPLVVQSVEALFVLVPEIGIATPPQPK
jgi:hypothetical protein